MFRINFEEFKQWINMHPIILKVFDETFHQEIWGNFTFVYKI